MQDGVPKDPRLAGFHVIRLLALAVAPQADLHAARHTPIHLRAHVQVAALGDDRLLRFDADIHGARRQIRQRLCQHTPRFFQGAGLQAADAHGGNNHHGAPGNALQAPPSHHGPGPEIADLARDAVVQRLHQIQRHAVGIGARQSLGVQLQGVAQVIVRAGIGLFDTRQGLLLPHPPQGRKNHADQQQQGRQPAHGAVYRSGQRQPGNQRLHRHTQQENGERHRGRQQKTLQQAALVKTALHLPYEPSENTVVMAHGGS